MAYIGTETVFVFDDPTQQLDRSIVVSGAMAEFISLLTC